MKQLAGDYYSPACRRCGCQNSKLVEARNKGGVSRVCENRKACNKRQQDKRKRNR